MRILGNDTIFDRVDNGRHFVQGEDTWDTIPSTWDAWTSYVTQPFPTMHYQLPLLDLGSVQTFNIISNIVARGTINYYIHYSSTSDVFAYDPVTFDSLNFDTLTINAGDTNIPSITARYIIIQLAIDYDPAQGHQYFDSISYQISTRSKTLTFANVDSSTLSGTTSNRLFSIGTDIGGIKSVQVTSHGSTNPFNVDMYVYHSTTSTKTFPDIISKNTNGVNLQFVGVDGQPRDSVFDITMEVLPEWYIDSFGNLVER